MMSGVSLGLLVKDKNAEGLATCLTSKHPKLTSLACFLLQDLFRQGTHYFDFVLQHYILILTFPIWGLLIPSVVYYC